jgi:tight adherence protein C
VLLMPSSAPSAPFASLLHFQIGILHFGPVETLVLALALAAALVTLWNLWRIGQREDRQERLAALRGAAIERAAMPAARGPRWYDRLGGIVAASRVIGVTEQHRLIGALSKAGFRSQGNLARFVACKLAAALLLTAALWTLTAAEGLFAAHPIYRIALVGGAAMLGWRLPDIVLSRIAARRRRQLEDGVPDALDLLVIAAEAGLSLDQAIEEVAHNLRTSNPATAEEFAATAAEMRVLADRSQALQNLVNRTGLAVLRSLTATLSQAIRFGTPLAESLRVIAAEMRNERIARMEERAARLPVLLAIPLMLFILPSLMIVIATPVVLRIADTLKNVFHV